MSRAKEIPLLFLVLVPNDSLPSLYTFAVEI